MSGLRNLAGILVLSAVGVPMVAVSQSRASDAPVQSFAACAGRLSAQMEYLWMFDGSAAEDVARERAVMLDLLDLVMPPDQGRTVLNWRIEAKVAHAALLTRATFGGDDRTRQRAQVMATRALESCRAMLLG